MNNWEKILGVKYPDCGMCGRCCKAATPSSPPIALIKKAGQGDSNARDLLNIFEPYESIEEIKKTYPTLVERAMQIASKSPKFDSCDQVVFYKCRYLSDKNNCMIYEDRPQLCRDYPDTPFLLMHEECAFKEWSTTCKERYSQLNNELKALKKLQEILKETELTNNEDHPLPVYSCYILPLSFSWLI